MTRTGWVLAAAMLAACGCEPAPSTGPSVLGSEASAPLAPTLPKTASPAETTDGAAPGEAPRAIYLIHIQLGSIEVPTGVASGSQELWNCLDEEPVSRHSSVLGLNGFRVGLGRPDAWPDIERVLKQMTGQNFRTVTIRALPGRTTFIDLKSRQPAQTIFTSFPDGTLSGRQYPPGDNLLTFACTLNEDDPSQILLTAVPQIRTTKRIPTLEGDRGNPAVVTRPILFTLTPLTFQLTIRRNDFLVIGPGVQANRPTSPGYQFLTKQRDGMTYETVLVFRPLVHSLEIPPQAPPQP
jgi:hypothetical protein